MIIYISFYFYVILRISYFYNLAYKKYLKMPKFVVIAASDDVFLPDASKLWFKQMPGENHFW